MRDLDLRLLRYFVAIADHASFTDAAETLGVTQPALSLALRRLEDIVGAPLIRRAPRGSSKALALTAAGEGLLEDSRALLVHAGRVLKRAGDNAHRLRIRVGFGTSTPQGLTRDILQKAAGIKDVELLLEFVNWGDERASLERGDVDVIFLQARQRSLDAAVEGIALQTVQRLAIFHADHPLAARSTVAIEDLDEVPIIDAASDRDYWIVNPRPTGRAPITVGPAARTVDEMLTFVSAGRGMAITSSTVAEKHNWPDLRFVPIAGLEPATVFLVALRSDRRPEVRSLMKTFVALV